MLCRRICGRASTGCSDRQADVGSGCRPGPQFRVSQSRAGSRQDFLRGSWGSPHFKLNGENVRNTTPSRDAKSSRDLPSTRRCLRNRRRGAASTRRWLQSGKRDVTLGRSGPGKRQRRRRLANGPRNRLRRDTTLPRCGNRTQGRSVSAAAGDMGRIVRRVADGVCQRGPAAGQDFSASRRRFAA
jgi:hypothetical protein